MKRKVAEMRGGEGEKEESPSQAACHTSRNTDVPDEQGFVFHRFRIKNSSWSLLHRVWRETCMIRGGQQSSCCTDIVLG